MGTKIEKAIAAGIKVCNDNSYGYSNDWPNNLFGVGNDPKNGDCGAFVSYCWWEAGVLPRGQYYEPIGSGANYNLYNEALLTNNGFKKIKYSGQSALIRGDILCSGGHTVMYLGNGRIMHARNDDDGRSGDGTGREVCEQAFYDNGTWCYVFRYMNDDNSSSNTDNNNNNSTSEEGFDVAKIRTLKYGMSGNDVKNLQALLNLWLSKMTPLDIDGQFGSLTEARLKIYQSIQGLTVDGICGPITWADILA